jgi:tRNA(fMet)-specific endonuclease VapC
MEQGSRNMSKKIWPVAYRIAELFPVIDIERAIMDVFGEIKSSLERRGTTVEDMDLLIAATAL